MATVYLLGNSPTASYWPWLTQYHLTQRFGQNGEQGVDIGTPYHTVITSLTSGIVAGMGYYAGGGVVSINTTVNGLPACVYYQHLDAIDPSIRAGMSVAPGQRLGLSGGQTSGGAHPSSPQYSTGPHTEVGVNATYGGMWNPNGYGPNVDPVPWLIGVARSGPSAAASIPQATGALVISASTAPGFTPIAQALNDAELLTPIDVTNVSGSLLQNAHALIVRAIIVGIGLMIVTAVIWRIAEARYNEQMQQAGELLGAAAPLAAL